MKRTDFIKIIRLRSAWKISKSKGNYDLPGGAKLSSYIGNLVDSQLAIDNLAVARDGNLCDAVGGAWNKEKKIFDDYRLIIPFKDYEVCSYDDQQERLKKLVYDIIFS